MDALSVAASIIAVIQLTGSLLKVCGSYIQEVKDAPDDILKLQRAIAGLQGKLQDLQKVLESGDRQALLTSSRLINNSNFTDCLSDLQTLQRRLDIAKEKKLVSRTGLRALKWPLKGTEVEGVTQKLERYISTITLALQVDQSNLLIDTAQSTERINQNFGLNGLPTNHRRDIMGAFNPHDVTMPIKGDSTSTIKSSSKLLLNHTGLTDGVNDTLYTPSPDLDLSTCSSGEGREQILFDSDHTARSSDNRSNISNPPSVFSLQSMQSTALTTDTQFTADEIRTAIDELVEIFINAKGMALLYREAILERQIARERFIRNFRRLLKHFAANLKEEARQAIDFELANLITSRAGLVADGVRKKLEQQYSQLDSLPGKLQGMLEVQALDASSDEDAEYGPEQALDVKFAALVAHGRSFIEESVAIQIFRKEFMKFVIPSQRNEELVVKTSLKGETRFPRMIRFLFSRSSRTLRLFLKYEALGWMKLQHLLSQIGLLEESIPKYHQRFRWTNRHGRKLYDDYVEHEPGALQALREYIETTTVSTNPKSANSQTSRAAFMYTPNPQPTPTHLPTSIDITTQSTNTPENTQIANALGDTRKSNPSTVPLLLLSCIERRGRPAKLHQEIVTNITDDRQLFHTLREIYYKHTGKLQSFWSLRALHGIYFMKFGYGGHGPIDVRCHPEPCEPGKFCGCIPPADRVSPQGEEYACRPIPSKLLPPFGPRYMMDLFQDPDSIKSNVDIILQQLPKKMSVELDSNGAEMMEAWGIFFRDGWNWMRIWVVLGVAFFPPSLLFGILWGIIRQDIQGAFGVASWWMTGATIAMGIIGSCT